jgi:hypothetical protein
MSGIYKSYRTGLPKSPFFKGGLLKEFRQVPPFGKGGVGGIWFLYGLPKVSFSYPLSARRGEMGEKTLLAIDIIT